MSNNRLIPPKQGRPRKFVKKDRRNSSWWSKSYNRIMIKMLAYYWYTDIFCHARGELAAALNGWLTKDTRERLEKFLSRYDSYEKTKAIWIRERLAIRLRPKEYKSDTEWFIQAVQRRITMMYRDYPGNGSKGKLTQRTSEHPENNEFLKLYLKESYKLFSELRNQ